MAFYPQKREEYLALLWKGRAVEDSASQLERILAYFFEVFSHFYSLRNIRNAAYALSLVGRFLATYKGGENISSSAFEICFSWSNKIMNRPLESFIYLAKGQSCEKKGSFKEAFSYFQKGYQVLSKVKEESDFYFLLRKAFLESLMELDKEVNQSQGFEEYRHNLEVLVSQWIPVDPEEYLPGHFHWEEDKTFDIQKVEQVLTNLSSSHEALEDEKTEEIRMHSLEEANLEEALKHVQNKHITMAMKALSPKDIQQALEEELAKEIEKEDQERASSPAEEKENLEIKDQQEKEKEEEVSKEEKVLELLKKAEEKLQKGYYKKVSTLCEEILTIEPNHDRAKKILQLAGELKIIMERLLRRAFLYEEENRLQEALQEWYKVLEMTPGHPKVLENIEKLKTRIHEQISNQWAETQQYFQKGKIRLALAKAQEILKLEPQHKECNQLVEQIKSNLKKGEQLLVQAQKALQEGDLNKAQKIAKEVLQLDPNKAEAKRILQEIQGGGFSDIEQKKKKIANALMEYTFPLVDLELKKEALQLAIVALSLDPGRSDALDMLKQLKSEVPELEKLVLQETRTRAILTEKEETNVEETLDKESITEVVDIEKGEAAFTRILEKRKATRAFIKGKEKLSLPLPPQQRSLASFKTMESKSRTPKNRKKLLSFLEEIQDDSES